MSSDNRCCFARLKVVCRQIVCNLELRRLGTLLIAMLLQILLEGYLIFSCLSVSLMTICLIKILHSDPDLSSVIITVYDNSGSGFIRGEVDENLRNCLEGRIPGRTSSQSSLG